MNFKTTLAAVATILLAASNATAEETNTWQPPAVYKDAKTGEITDIVVGNPDAPVTIYEYASLTCPHCKSYQDLAADTVQKEWIDTDKAKLVFRHFPLDNAALAAALTVQCLPVEKRYDTVKLFFGSVDRWQGNTENLVTVLEEAYGKDLPFAVPTEAERAESEAARKAAAEASGTEYKPAAPALTNVEKLVACLDRKGFAERTLQGMVEASTNGVNSTPYFIVGGEHIRGAQPAEKMGEVIRKHLPNE